MCVCVCVCVRRLVYGSDVLYGLYVFVCFLHDCVCVCMLFACDVCVCMCL